MDYNRILSEIAAEIEPLRNEGQQADYIPALAEVNPDRFGMCITSTRRSDRVGRCGGEILHTEYHQGVFTFNGPFYHG